MTDPAPLCACEACRRTDRALRWYAATRRALCDDCRPVAAVLPLRLDPNQPPAPLRATRRA